MGSNEIRLRKQKLNPGRVARHRNYAELMRKHERSLKTRHLIVVLVYFIVVLIMLFISLMIIRMEKKKELKNVRAYAFSIDHSTQPLPVRTLLIRE